MSALNGIVKKPRQIFVSTMSGLNWRLKRFFVCYLDEEIVGSELRERLVGLTTTWLLLLMIYVMRGDVIRIISARMVTKAEREIYENQ